jgi:hypothetical protein
MVYAQLTVKTTAYKSLQKWSKDKDKKLPSEKEFFKCYAVDKDMKSEFIELAHAVGHTRDEVTDFLNQVGKRILEYDDKTLTERIGKHQDSMKHSLEEVSAAYVAYKDYLGRKEDYLLEQHGGSGGMNDLDANSDVSAPGSSDVTNNPLTVSGNGNDPPPPPVTDLTAELSNSNLPSGTPDDWDEYDLMEIAKKDGGDKFIMGYGPSEDKPEKVYASLENSGLPHDGQEDDVNTVQLVHKSVIYEVIGYDKRYVASHAGKFSIAGGLRRYANMIDWLKAMEKAGFPIRYVWAACLQYALKPPEILKKGRTKSGKGDGFGFSKEMAYFLPLVRDDEIESNSNTMRSYQKRRTTHPAWAKYINKSMTWRVAFFYLSKFYLDDEMDMLATKDELLKQWHENMNYNPINATDEMIMRTAPSKVKAEAEMIQPNGETKMNQWLRIRKEQYKDVSDGIKYARMLPHFFSNDNNQGLLDRIYSKLFVKPFEVDANNRIYYTLSPENMVDPRTFN